jgi:hypothetical protein
MYNVRPVSRLDSSSASFTRCASPPDSVVADWLIDMGPEGGAGGGRVLAVGPPEVIAECAESFTGRFLKPLLQLG